MARTRRRVAMMRATGWRRMVMAWREVLVEGVVAARRRFVLARD